MKLRGDAFTLARYYPRNCFAKGETMHPYYAFSSCWCTRTPNMTVQFSQDDLRLLARETRAFAYLALTLSDGTPQVSPIWFDWDGTHFIINTARGRVKDKILKKHPVVAMTITAD